STFVVAHSHHAPMIKEWKRDIENRRDKARNYLISGENTVEFRDDEVQLEVVATEIPTNSFRAPTTTVPLVTITTAISFPTKMDIIKQFTLNSQQKYAFMIVTSHLDVLDRPLYHSCASSEQITERQIDMQCAQKLISQMNCVVELSQQMRTEDLRYLNLLNRLRSGKSTIEDYQLLCTRIVGNPKLPASLRQTPWNEVGSNTRFRNTLRTQINNRAVLNKEMKMVLQPMVWSG
ncbi:unnamed protein product, partial [Rotaria magnacalcarata]